VALRETIRSIARDAARLLAVGLPVALLVSLAFAYGTLLIDALGGFGRLAALAVALPVVLAVPLLGWVAAERVHGRELTQVLNRMQSRDPVTGFLRPSVMAGLVERRAAQGDRPGGAFLVIDASQLGALNLAHGFEWHDEALQHVAGAIRASVRSGDMVARIGPDSFVVFLAGAEVDDALTVGERVRAAVAKVYFAPGGVAQMLNVKVGGVVFDETPDMQELYVEAMHTLERAAASSPIVLRNLGTGAAAS
jgi:diguanylate cyclase (GGDEF)-like protein